MTPEQQQIIQDALQRAQAKRIAVGKPPRARRRSYKRLAAVLERVIAGRNL